MSEPTLQDCINYMRRQIRQMEKYPRNYEFNLPYYRKTVELLEKDRPRGEWIKKYNADDPTTVCSVCGFDTEDKVYFNFCPNCGSDNRPKIHGCSFASEECKKNPCEDCGLREGEEE